MLLDHLVVDPQQEEGGSPLPNEQCMMILASGLEDEGANDRGEGRAQEKTAGQLGGVALHHGGSLIFRYFSGAYAIIHFEISCLANTGLDGELWPPKERIKIPLNR